MQYKNKINGTENPGTNICRVARALGIPCTTVHRVLRKNELCSFHYQRVQQLLQRNKEQRIYFCDDIFIF